MDLFEAREIVYDAERKVLVFSNCVFHPFVPIFRRSSTISLRDVGLPFVARSAERRFGRVTVGARYVLPTALGYVYFRSTRYAEMRDLVFIRRLLRTNGISESATRRKALHQFVGPIAAALFVLGAVAALWIYYRQILPTL